MRFQRWRRRSLWITAVTPADGVIHLIKLCRVSAHMAFAEGDTVRVQSAWVSRWEGDTEGKTVTYIGPDTYAFCLETETHEPEMPVGLQHFGEGRVDCADSSFRLTPESLALTRAMCWGLIGYSSWVSLWIG